MIAFERLAALALRELSDADAADVEEHVLGCGACAAVVERLVDLGEQVFALARAGGAAGLLAGSAIVDLLEREHLVTRTYRLDPGGEVACTVDARDVYTAVRLGVDARGVRRVDLIYESPTARYRVEDLPFDRTGGEVTFVQPAEYLRTLSSERKTLRLVSVEEGGDRLLGEYVMNHTAFRPA